MSSSRVSIIADVRDGLQQAADFVVHVSGADDRSQRGQQVAALAGLLHRANNRRQQQVGRVGHGTQNCRPHPLVGPIPRRQSYQPRQRSLVVRLAKCHRQLQTNGRVRVVDSLEDGRETLLVMHLGLETPEMRALVDVNNPRDPYRAAQHRQAELQALTSAAFLRAVEERGIGFVTYRDLVERRGLEAMRRPEDTGYSMD